MRYIFCSCSYQLAMSGLVFYSRTLYIQTMLGDLTCDFSIMMLSLVALSHAAKHTLWPHISRACVTVSLKAHIDYYHLEKAPCITEQSLRIKFSANNWVHGRVNVKLFASHSWAALFFSISLMCQSYSSRLCANSYWIFIKTQTNINRCASGVALKINLLNSTKLPHKHLLGPHYPSKVILIPMWVNFASLTKRFPSLLTPEPCAPSLL